MLDEVIPWIRDEIAGGQDLTKLRPEGVLVSVVMPAYEEGPASSRSSGALGAALPLDREILVVCDMETDPRCRRSTSSPLRSPGLRAHLNSDGRGVLRAMRSGIAASRGRYVVITMADGSDDPASLGPMVAAADAGADVVAASRYMRGGRQVGGPRVKRLMSRAAGLSLHWFAGVPTHDPTNNFKLYRRDFLETVHIESSAGFELALELTVKATAAGRRVDEVPTTWRDRTEGQSRFQAAQVAAPLPPLVCLRIPDSDPARGAPALCECVPGRAGRHWRAAGSRGIADGVDGPRVGACRRGHRDRCRCADRASADGGLPR